MSGSNVWSNLHEHYQDQDWINRPNQFAETAAKYFSKSAHMLELGAGQGQDSRFFANQGFTVISTDLEQKALDIGRSKLSADQSKLVATKLVDLRNDLPFPDESFEAVYAHLSLHYFDHERTVHLFDEIARVLKPSGVLAFLVNSINDPEYNTGKRLEDGYFEVGHAQKRYFSVESAGSFTGQFQAKLLDDQGETYKDAAKGVHNLIRYIGIKKA